MLGGRACPSWGTLFRRRSALYVLQSPPAALLDEKPALTLPAGSQLSGWTPLIQAASKDQLELMEILLDGGADIEKRAAEGPTALGWALGYGSEAAAALLLRRGACAESA